MTAKQKTTYVAVAPDGTEHTRTSHRVYTHAVLVYGPEPNWGCVGFSGREELAHKEARRWAGRREQVIVVPVSTR